MEVKKEKERDRKTESEDNRGRRNLEPVQRLGWLPGVWAEEAIAGEGGTERLLPSVLHNSQNGRAGAATQAVHLAPVFPQLQVTEATVGI